MERSDKIPTKVDRGTLVHRSYELFRKRHFIRIDGKREVFNTNHASRAAISELFKMGITPEKIFLTLIKQTSLEPKDIFDSYTEGIESWRDLLIEASAGILTDELETLHPEYEFVEEVRESLKRRIR